MRYVTALALFSCLIGCKNEAYDIAWQCKVGGHIPAQLTREYLVDETVKSSKYKLYTSDGIRANYVFIYCERDTIKAIWKEWTANEF